MENSIPVKNQFPPPPTEPSDNSALHSFGNGYKATPVNQSFIYSIQRLLYFRLIFLELFKHILERINNPLSGLFWRTEKCRTEEIRGGALSIRHVVSFLTDVKPKVRKKSKKFSGSFISDCFTKKYCFFSKYFFEAIHFSSIFVGPSI